MLAKVIYVYNIVQQYNEYGCIGHEQHKFLKILSAHLVLPYLWSLNCGWCPAL